MEIEIIRDQPEGTQIVAIAGYVDVDTAPELDAALAELASAGRVIVDLSKADFLDSTGIGVLVKAKKKAVETKGAVILVIATPVILKPFQITGLDEVFTICSTREEAIGA